VQLHSSKVLENKTIGPWQVLIISYIDHNVSLYIIRNDMPNEEALRVHEVFHNTKDALSRYKVLSNELTTLLHEVIEDATVTCLLCNAPMVMRSGKYGTFYACSKNNETGCVCTVDSTGKPSKKTKIVLVTKRPKATVELDKLLGQSNIQKRIAKIEID
jgi:hypothetical protein